MDKEDLLLQLGSIEARTMVAAPCCSVLTGFSLPSFAVRGRVLVESNVFLGGRGAYLRSPLRRV